jgi:hypothetical protein
MTSNYLIVLFKNKVKKKIIKKFKTKNNAITFYQKLMDESDEVIFNKTYENGVPSKYELAILSKSDKDNNTNYIKDELGRQIKVELDYNGFNIMKIGDYRIEELFVDYKTKDKINSSQFIKKYLSGDGLKLVSKLNNKVIVQLDDNFNMFTFKTCDDSDKFINDLSNNFKSIKRSDCLFVKDSSTAQRKYLYELLVGQGFPKSYLFRQSTTHPTKK